jgi:thiol:disulfide interchange protein DsbD
MAGLQVDWGPVFLSTFGVLGHLYFMRIIAILIAGVLSCLSLPAASESHTKADLLLPVETARPGDTIMAAVRLRSEPKWHTYWKNPGSSGAATEIKWQLPEGVTAGEIRWPVPERLVVEEETTFVLHDEVLLLVPLKLAAGVKPGPKELKATVSWLECMEQCVLGDAVVTASFSVGSEVKASAQAAAIAAAEAALPRDGSALGVSSAWEEATTNTRNLLVEWPVSAPATDADFLPYASDDFEVGLKPERLPADASRVSLRLTVKKNTANWPGKIAGVIVQKIGGQRQAFEVVLAPAASGASAVPALASRSTQSGLDTGASTAGNPIKFLFLCLLGGLILNLMPCVLPILSLKVLSIVNQHGAPASHARKHALVYTLGVLVSFWALAGLVLAGRLASWGEQFQDPRFVVIMTVLMTLVALNLFGVFELILPGATTNKATELAGREGFSGAFFNGILAVVLGASCVAPVLAAAVGWAISQPPVVILLAFSMIGLGLALPFVLLSFFPALQKALPRPGAWMGKFKTAMGFPMLATAAWLLAQTADHFGNSGPLWVGLFLVLLALAVWIYGEFHQRGAKRRGLSAGIAVVIAVGAYGWTLEQQLHWRNPPAVVTGAQSASAGAGDSIAWQPWSAEAVAKARAAGRPVLVDFTANWCLTCQLNKKTSLEIDSVRAKLKAVNAVALLGDYTRKNPAITAELKRFERAGVPLVLVYPKDATQPPQLLPTVLTPDIVLNALDAAIK